MIKYFYIFIFLLFVNFGFSQASVTHTYTPKSNLVTTETQFVVNFSEVPDFYRIYALTPSEDMVANGASDPTYISSCLPASISSTDYFKAQVGEYRELFFEAYGDSDCLGSFIEKVILTDSNFSDENFLIVLDSSNAYNTGYLFTTDTFANMAIWSITVLTLLGLGVRFMRGMR